MRLVYLSEQFYSEYGHCPEILKKLIYSISFFLVHLFLSQILGAETDA